MINFTDYIVWMVRVTTGILLGLIGIQPLDIQHNFGTDPVYPVILSDTNVLLLDVILRVLFIVFGLAIILGIRTRLIAAFMLSVTLLESIQCLHIHQSWTAGHVALALTLLGLCALIVKGGGQHSLVRGGWSDIPF